MLIPGFSPIYAPNAVVLDGSTDYLTRGADLTGAVDGEQFSFSGWLNTSSATAQNVFGNGVYCSLNINGSTNIKGQFRDSAATVRAQFTLEVDVIDGEWHHLAFSFDKNNVGDRHVYLDGNDASGDVTWNVYDSTNNIDFTRGQFAVGASTESGGALFNGSLAEIFINTTLIDLSDAAELAKFIKDGRPSLRDADGGYGGAGAPLIWLSGDVSTWSTNKGTGGGFTVTGALANSTNIPVQL